jgi:predicted metal-dependent hydrolase
MMNALSSVFPPGEAFFVRSVQHYRDHIEEPELRAAMQAFGGQEGQHSRHHERHVELLVGQGFRLIESRNRIMRRVMPWVNRNFPRFSLASTAALEHLTAIMARQMMRRPERWTGPMDPRMAPLWLWHAVEEAEHKAVAFDVLQRVAPSYPLRVVAMLLSVLDLFSETWLRTSYMLWVDGRLFEPRLWWRGLGFVWGREGILRGSGRDFLRWFRRDFHPDEVDDAELLAKWRPRVAA